MDIKKLLVNPNMTIGMISLIIRKEMKDPDESLYFLINKKRSVTYEITLKEIYNKYKADDDMLYLEACTAELWG